MFTHLQYSENNTLYNSVYNNVYNNIQYTLHCYVYYSLHYILHDSLQYNMYYSLLCTLQYNVLYLPMSKIIAFATQKGGSGKSTLCAITASAVHNRTGNKVLVIDADKQATLKNLQKIEGEPTGGYPVLFFNWEQANAHDKFISLIEREDKQYDVIFIDCPGRIDKKETSLIVAASDIVVVPLVASAFDVASVRVFLDEITSLVKKQDKQVVGIINKRDRTVEHAILSQLDGYAGMELMTSYISNLARYKRDVSTVAELVPADDPTDEYNMYIKEFIKLLK